MSEMVHYKGTLQKVISKDGEKLEELCRRLLNDNGITRSESWNSSWEEVFRDEFYKEAVIVDGEVFMVEKESIDPDSDVYNAHKNRDGSIHFEVMYYDGGCSFDEAIKTALKSLESEEK